MRKIAVVIVGLLLLTLSMPLPARRAVLQVYRVYLPVVAKPFTGSGLAWGTRSEELSADWCYNNSGSGNCYLSHPDFASFSPCPNVALIGNEPDGIVLSGYPMEAQEAAQRSRLIRAECSQTYLIAGNTIQGDEVHWLDDYIREGGAYSALGTHCYSLLAQTCIDILTAFKARFADKALCLTEWNIGRTKPATAERIAEFKKFLDWVQREFSCSAVYTDRAPEPWDVHDLLNEDGSLNRLGLLYANRGKALFPVGETEGHNLIGGIP